MGRNHLKALAGAKEIRIAAIAEPSTAARASLDTSGARLFPDLDTMLASGGLDGVLLCVPSDYHLDTVKRVVAAGLPILAEKPFGVTAAQAGEATQLVAAASLPLQIGFWRRFVPMLRQLKQRIASGELGDVYSVVCYQWDGQPPSAYFRTHSGGIFVDMGVHDFEQIRWLTGQEFDTITAVAAGAADDPWPGDPESAQVLAKLSGGSTAIVSLGRRYSPGDMCRVEVFGTKGADECRFLWPPTSDATFLTAVRAQAESFVRHVKGGPLEGATGHDATAALRAAEMAAASIAAVESAK
jgi:myo-inositol 2-dehydrogenase/D-chiro-inositol 1-dehydrogenase